MTIQGPLGKENLDISFRLQSKPQLFDGSNNALLGARCDIVASGSCHGIVFVGSSSPELIVVCLKDLEGAQNPEQNVPMRKVPLLSPTSQIATNCDGSILAVALKLNGAPHIELYSVASFLTPNVQKIREFTIPGDNSEVTQLCWNPVMNGTLAICTAAGRFISYTINEKEQKFQALDQNLKARCCCWSPKGKQIVVGFGNGKLMQFTPELKPAKSIECPPGVVPGGSFDTIAIQWLSTFQFAVAFLAHQPDSRPVLHIVNAPKAGPPQFISYNDVCYSTSETRPSRIYLQHIMQWNLLLVSSANAIDVSFLRISQPGDLPVWTQEFPNDLYPAELPLTPSKDESYPAGFAIETGCANRLLQEDGITPYPVMPMVHILSTYGVLCSFYILNTSPGYVDICSPPRPLDPAALSLFKVIQPAAAPLQEQSPLLTPPKPEISFSQPMGQSTPALPKFPNPTTAKPAPVSNFSGSLFGNLTQPTPPFGLNLTSAPSAFQSVAQTSTPSTTPTSNLIQTQPAAALITVPQTYTSSAPKTTESSVKQASVDQASTAEDELVYTRMIQDEIKAFELELRALMEKSRSLTVNIGTKEESAEMRRSIEELDELKKEATETIDSLRSDVQSSRLGITEMFSMVYEARTKFEHAKNETSIFLNQNQFQDRTSKRTLDRLVKQVSQCEMQLQVAIQVMNSQWSNYQEVISKSKKNRMHTPSLEELYQTLTKQQEIIYTQSEKMSALKSKLGLRDNFMKQKSITNTTIESFSDSMISISLADQVEKENSKLTKNKLQSLQNLLEQRAVITIKPQRPDRSGLNSEIIREKKLQTLKALKKSKPVEAKNVVNGQRISTVQLTQPAQTLQQKIPQQVSFVPPPKAEEPGKRSFSAFGINADSSQGNQATFSIGSKTTEPSKVPFTGFGVSASQSGQISFGVSQSEEPEKTSFGGFGSSQNSSFGISLTSSSKPSFTLSSSPLVLGVEKKREEATAALVSSSTSTNQPPRLYLNPAALKNTSETNKTPSTISNANVAVSATFSIPLANKVTSATKSDHPKVFERAQDENKPLTTNENTSFTFKLSEKKDESPVVTIKAPSTNFSALKLTSTNDSSKGFSFASGGTTAPFDIGSKIAEPPKSLLAATTTATVFSGFGSTLTTTASGSLFSSSSAPSFTSFGSGLPGFGNENTKSTGFSLNLGSISDSTKPPTSVESFSFASLASTAKTSSNETKPLTEPISLTSSSKPATASTFSFGGALAQAIASTKNETADAAPAPPSFSFASLTPATSPDDSKTTSTPSPSVSSPSTETVDSVIDGLKICAPEVSKSVSPSPSANIFASSGIPTTSAVKSDASSLFSSNAFGSAFGQTSTIAPAFGSTSLVHTTASLAAPTPSTTVQTSIFGAQNTPTTSAPSPSIFGSLSLGSADANKASPTSPPTGLFSSLVKPDQSVFGATSTVSTPTISSFGGSFSGSTTPSSNIFGAPSPANATSSNIFGAPTNQQAPSGNIFGSPQPTTTQANAFGSPPKTQSSIFGQNTASNATGGSLFSQSSFTSAAPATNIFGGSSQTTSFGSTNIFGSGGTAQQPATATSSIFGGQSSFASQPSSGSVFGGSSPIAAPSPFGSSSVFGGAATFSNSFSGVGQTGFGSSASAFNQQSPTFGGGATFGSPKANIFGQQSTAGQSNNLFEQLGSQQQSGNLFGNMVQNNPPAQPPPSGFQGSAFSSWR